MTKLYSKSTRHVWIVQYASYICPCMQPKFLSTVAVVNISAMVVFMRWLRKHMGEVEWVVKLHSVEFMGIHLAAAQVKRMIMDWNVLGIGHIWMDVRWNWWKMHCGKGRMNERSYEKDNPGNMFGYKSMLSREVQWEKRRKILQRKWLCIKTPMLRGYVVGTYIGP